MRPRTTFLYLAFPAVAWAIQLSPEIQADRYLVRAERKIEEQDLVVAKESLDRILELQEQHDIEVPSEFSVMYARVSLGLGLHAEAIESATRYLTLEGREGEHYRTALELLDRAEEEKATAEAEAERAEAQLRAVREAFDAIEFVRIPAGEFLMGSTAENAAWDEEPATRVRISQAFWLGKYEVKQAEWETFMGENPSHFDGCGPDCPVENVSWDDAQRFVERLNFLSSAYGDGAEYRLPTEAEWEYAARAGTSQDRYSDDLEAIAWYDGNSEGRTHPVGQKAPNVWGLHDMLGNVFEMVQDWHGDYPGGTVTDPQGPMSGLRRVVRGGCWNFDAHSARAVYRVVTDPGSGGANTGFRLLKTE